ncbi:MAG: putative transporter [Cytophagales bacterium]|nr:putative transporter [Cytophagales bacterium]
MFKAFYASKEWAFKAYGGLFLLIASIWVQVQMTVAFNEWYGKFYNLLQKAGDYKDKSQEGIDKFFDLLSSLDYITNGFEGQPSFLVIAMPIVLLHTVLSWYTRVYGLMWREAITFYYVDLWKSSTGDLEGASQRIQEDCYKFAKIVEKLGLDVVKAILTLIAFIPILWKLSNGVNMPFFEGVEGSLVWVALSVSIGGLAISWFVGGKLPGLEYNNQKVEASFRKELVLAEDNPEDYASPSTILELFTGIKFNYKRLFMHYGYFDVWISLYGQFMVIVPYLIVGPSLFTGAITLGVLIQVSNAFSKVHEGFSVFLQNWTTITELRSIHKRLKEFHTNLQLKQK